MAITRASAGSRVTQLYIECVMHPVKVKFVTSAYISKLFGSSAEGMYDSVRNTIYLNKNLSELERLHHLGHELKHAFDHQTQSMSEEDICDAFGALLIRLTGAEVAKDLCL